MQNAPDRDIPTSLALQYGFPTQSRDTPTSTFQTVPPSTTTPTPTPEGPPITPAIKKKKTKELPITMIQAYLANERTFLAWIRTAISLMALGIAVARIIPTFRDQGSQVTIPYLASTTGTAFVVLGISTIIFGISRFRGTNAFLESGKTHFPVQNFLMWLLSGFVIICAGLSLALVAVTFTWGSRRTS